MEKKRLFRKLDRDKHAQAVFGISFGVIFSVILIVVFIIFAVVVIKFLLGTGDCASFGLFIDGFEKKVETSYKSQKASGEEALYESSLPGKVNFVCFVDFSKPGKGIHKSKLSDAQLYVGDEYNLFFWPLGAAGDCGLEGVSIRHLDIEELVSFNNPYCFENSGKVKIQLDKGFNDVNVKVLR